MRLIYTISIGLLFQTFLLNAQYIIKKEDNFLYRKETSFGFNINSNGGGFLSGISFKHSRVISRRWYHLFYLDITQIKDGSEERTNTANSSYIPNKIHYLYNLRLQYGQEFILFKKAKKNGIQIDAFVVGGLNLGIEAPYCIRFQESPGLLEKIVPYDPNIHDQASIQGFGGFLPNLSLSKYVPGISIKGGLSFEFGVGTYSTTGFDIGFNVDVFSRKIVLLTTVPGKFFFPSLYINLYFGSRQ